MTQALFLSNTAYYRIPCKTPAISLLRKLYTFYIPNYYSEYREVPPEK